MSVAPALPFLKRRTRPRLALATRPVDVFAPDRRLAHLLLEHLTPSVGGEIVPGLVWTVRLRPRDPGGAWVPELLALVERWLGAAGLPWVTVVYEGCAYLIRADSPVLRFLAAASEPGVPVAARTLR